MNLKVVKFSLEKNKLAWYDFESREKRGTADFFPILEALNDHHLAAISSSTGRILKTRKKDQAIFSFIHECESKFKMEILAQWNGESDEVNFTATVPTKCGCTLESTRKFYQRNPNFKLNLVRARKIRTVPEGEVLSRESRLRIGQAFFGVVDEDEPVGSILTILATKSDSNQPLRALPSGNIEMMDASLKAFAAVSSLLKEKRLPSLNEAGLFVEVKDDVSVTGPSLGLAISAALLSLALKKPLKSHFMLTGAVSINGEVTEIGGCSEKLAAAEVNGFAAVFPDENREELADKEVQFVSEIADLLNIVFDLPNSS